MSTFEVIFSGKKMIFVLDNAPYHNTIALHAVLPPAKMCKAKPVVDFDGRGTIVLFTPPYSADLQPIELWWAAGKNWARAHRIGRRAR